jgi:hypothetical protein
MTYILHNGVVDLTTLDNILGRSGIGRECL